MRPVVLSESIPKAIPLMSLSHHVRRITVCTSSVMGRVVVSCHIVVVKTVVAKTRPTLPPVTFEVDTVRLCLQQLFAVLLFIYYWGLGVTKSASVSVLTFSLARKEEVGFSWSHALSRCVTNSRAAHELPFLKQNLYKSSRHHTHEIPSSIDDREARVRSV